MIVAELVLQNFRSYTKKTFAFSPGATLIVGPNASGKTNILEALFMFATGKSFRAGQDKEIIGWGTQFSRVKAVLDETKLELLVTGETKKYKVNGVPRRQLDFVGNLRAVLFWPEDLELVTDSPSLRRKYLDSVLVQVDRQYRRNLLSYERALRQRNRLLDLINEGKAHRHQLYFWNQLLIGAGGYLTDKRAEYIDFANTQALSVKEESKKGKNFTLAASRFTLAYDKSVISDSRLIQYKDEEIAAGATLVGPHRDNFIVYINEKELSKYGSRGEQRLAILRLKLSELSYIERETGERPILLLDDIFSELDEEHRNLVFDSIGNQQTIITSADEQSIPKTHRKGMKMIQL